MIVVTSIELHFIESGSIYFLSILPIPEELRMKRAFPVLKNRHPMKSKPTCSKYTFRFQSSPTMKYTDWISVRAISLPVSRTIESNQIHHQSYEPG